MLKNVLPAGSSSLICSQQPPHCLCSPSIHGMDIISWNGYHWARTKNPFTLKLGKNITSAWTQAVTNASVDWSRSSVLDTTLVAGSVNARTCSPSISRAAWVASDRNRLHLKEVALIVICPNTANIKRRLP